MQKRIFRGALLLTLATALVIGLLSAAVYYHRSGEQLESQLWQELDMLSTLMEQSADQDAEEAALKALNMPNRLTWIAPDGTVRYDNQSNAASMENHLGREEIAQASETGTGFSRRFSQTLLEEQLYCAKKLDDGSYLRVAATQSSLAGSLWRMGGALVAGIAVVLIAAAVLSRLWTRSLVRPINEINLENPLQNRVYDELTPMLRRMAEQNRRLETQMREINARRGELETIIGHMNEGLLILDAHRHVLLMNDSARAILHTGLPADGKTPLSVYNRSQTLLDTVEKAIAEGGAHADMSAGGREYLLTASTVRHNEGLVVLLQDVTERNASEAARKRFTANVSHELRTPLTTISGYAELIQSGMTEPKDIPVFARKIYNESRRLLKLIEDIMHLSKLDEGFAAGCLRRVDLLEAARTAVEENAEAAGDRNVTVRLTGESVFINADPTLLDEMLRNVIENGVKYNRLNGEVQVEVSRLADGARVRVTDTGIGIPQEHQDKVFERFYRVDGSRSKQTGGTGLGLSIVKHGAEYHHAKVELNSEVGPRHRGDHDLSPGHRRGTRSVTNKKALPPGWSGGAFCIYAFRNKENQALPPVSPSSMGSGSTGRRSGRVSSSPAASGLSAASPASFSSLSQSAPSGAASVSGALSSPSGADSPSGAESSPSGTSPSASTRAYRWARSTVSCSSRELSSLSMSPSGWGMGSPCCHKSSARTGISLSSSRRRVSRLISFSF